MDNKLSLTHLLQEFLTSLEAQGLAHRTLECYRERLAPFVAYLAERSKHQLDQIGPADVDEYVAHCRRRREKWREHHLRPMVKGSLSEATLAGYIQALKAFGAWCARRGHVAASPMAHLKKQRVKLAADDRAIDPKDLQRLAHAARQHSVRAYALVLLLADTGCRAGEVCNLELADINWEAREAKVQGKTGARVVDFGKRTAKILRRWLVVRPEVEHTYLFTGKHDQPLAYGGLYSILRELGASTGVKRFNPHAIRHLVGQNWLDQGANLELVRQKLGHQDISTTADFYAHQDRDRLKAASRKFSLTRGL